MCVTINCPKCKTNKARAIDQLPLEMFTKEEVEKQEIPYQYQYDNVLYMTFGCDNCGKLFSVIFDLIPQSK